MRQSEPDPILEKVRFVSRRGRRDVRGSGGRWFLNVDKGKDATRALRDALKGCRVGRTGYGDPPSPGPGPWQERKPHTR